MREERKTVTALFADLVGSSELVEKLDPEEARDLLGGGIERVVLTIEEFGGTIKDLAGDGVLALFGAPVAYEDDPERAVRAGLRIVKDVAAYGHDLAVRVGIESGLVVLGPVGAGSRVEYGAVGDAVNTAARLQAAAAPCTVLVGAATQRWIAPLFEWGPRQELELKGKTEPVVAFRAVGVRPEPGQLRGLEGVEAPLVGRERELGAAGRAVEDLLGGRGGFLVVVGDPGVGKSRLLAELRRLAEGVEWIEGRCLSFGQTVPYSAYRDLVRDWLGLSPADPERAVAEVLSRRIGDEEIRPYIAGMLGFPLEDELAQLSPEALQYRTFEAIGALLARLAQDGPLVIAIEDLHWADATSVQLTERLLPLTREASVLLIITQRPERDLAAWVLAERAGDRLLVLDALDHDAEEELLHALVGVATLPAELERRLRAAAEGNPFFLEELVRSLIAMGALVRIEGGFRFKHDAPVEVPVTIEKVILARVDRLDAAPRGALAAASVLGRRFGLELLRQVAGGNGSLAEALAELEHVDLLSRAGGEPLREYRFKHALIQEAVYNSLLRKQRRELHRAAAEALERLFRDHLEPHFGILAHHWSAAGERAKALDYRTVAAEAARRVYAVDEALRHYSAALELVATLGQDPCLLYLERGIVGAQTGRIAQARADVENALALARGSGNQPAELRALSELGFLLAGAADYRQSIPLLEGALELAEKLGDRAELASVLSRLSIVHTNRLEFDRALERSHRAVSLAGELGDRRALALALDSLELVSVMIGDFRTVEESARALVELHRAAGDLWYLQYAIYQWSWAATGRAEWKQAVARLEEGQVINRRIDDRGGTPLFLATLAWIGRSRGEYGWSLALGREAVALAHVVGHPEMMAWSQANLGRTLLELGQLVEAVECLEAARQAAQGAGARIELVRAVAYLALGCWLLGHEGLASARLEEAERLVAMVTVPPGRAYLQGADANMALARVRLERGEGERVERLLTPVLAAAESAGWIEFIAEASLLLGRCREDRPLLERALAIAQDCGLRRLAWEARVALGRKAEARASAEELSRTIDDAEIRATFLHTMEVEA